MAWGFFNAFTSRNNSGLLAGRSVTDGAESGFVQAVTLAEAGADQFNNSNTAGTATVAAPGAGAYLVLTSVTVSNASATAELVTLTDGGTVRWQCYAAASGGGGSAQFPTGLRWTANTAIVTTGANAKVTLTGYTTKAAS